jgi:hypothetical protein
MGRLADLADAIQAAGIPINGVAITGPDTAPTSVTVDYRAEATQGQRTQGDALAAGWDWTPRRPRRDADLLAALSALSDADRSKLLALAAADLLQRRPGLARAFGIALDGDEKA